jgi:MFS transporter, PAT family, beta-lactamase induction signal transducer AmpG
MPILSVNGPDSGTKRETWREALRAYCRKPVVAMLFLGFSSGLPFYLVFATLSAWLRQAGINRALIGMLSWVGILYSVKFIWAPLVDRLRLPLLNRILGRRRAWMLLAQSGLIVGLLSLSRADPAAGIHTMAVWALFVAFCAATQDIALDAWRIESSSVETQGPMLAAYQVGYRIALTTAGAGALAIAQFSGWHVSYSTMAALVGIGIVTTLFVPEPHPSVPEESAVREERVIQWMEARAHWPRPLLNAGEWVMGAVVCPLLDFFGRYGFTLALLTLIYIGTYRLTEFAIGSMINPFYVDHGYTLDQIALVGKAYGLAAAIAGVLLAGLLITKVGLLRCLVLGSVLLMCSNLGFALLATTHTPTLLGLGLVNALDNIALALQGTSLIVFLSGLTSSKYTATQYALFSSLYALPGKLLEGFSGIIVNHVGYPVFFVYTALLSLIGLFMLYVLTRWGLSRSGVLAHASGA